MKNNYKIITNKEGLLLAGRKFYPHSTAVPFSWSSLILVL